MIPYHLICSKRKTLAIYITKDAEVEVRAPFRVSTVEVERFLTQKQCWIEKHIQRVKQQKADINKIILTKEQELALKARAKEVILARVSYYAHSMGVTPSAVKISSARTRWGSCSGKNSLNFSWRLMLGDMDLLDYVVVHELAHIKEHNHSKRFWALVASVLPDYQKRRKKLRELEDRL